MRNYLQYKTTCIDSIGDIPNNWQLVPLKKYLISIVDYRGKTPTKKEDGEVFLVTARNIKGGIIDYSLSQEFISKDDYEQVMQRGKPIIGDVLFTTEAPLGEVANVDRDDIALAQRIIKFRAKPNFLDNHYLKLWLSSQPFQNDLQRYATGSTALGIKASKLNFLKLLLPSIDEQTKIVSYLDSKIRKIDYLISKKQKLIDLLKEECNAVIHQAVTKGVNPDVEMKDSGIEWLGKIPKHWEIKRLKYVANITLGKMLTNEDKGNYYQKPYLRAQNISWFDVNSSDIKEMWFSKNELEQYKLRENDLLVSEGGEVGRTAIWKNELTECYIQNSVHKVTIKNSNSPYYYLNLFFLYGHRGYFDSIVNKISIAHLTREKLKEIKILVPPGEEQNKIVKFIQGETDKIYLTITKIQKEIGLLQEYRTALISEVVTGKIDVRDEVVSWT